MRRESAAHDLGRRPRIETATILPKGGLETLDEVDSEGTDVETLVSTLRTTGLRAVSLIPITVTDDDLIPIDSDDDGGTEEDDDTEYNNLQIPNAPVLGLERQPPTEAAIVISAAHPGGYNLVRRIGATALGDIYVAEKPMCFGIPRRGFLKRLPRTSSAYPKKRHALLLDAKTGAAFNHPNLVAVTHAGEDEDGVHVAFEHVEGTNLARVNRAMQERREAMPFEIVAWIVAEVLRGIHHAHELTDDRGQPMNLVVGELSPDNVLISRTGQAKLATFAVRIATEGDFDVVSEMTDRATAYLAPECLTQSEWTVRSDVYAVGLMLFELLAGRACFSSTSKGSIYLQTISEGIPMSVLRDEDVPEGLLKIVERATHRMPGHRFQSALSMATALNTWIHDSGRHAMPSLVSRFFDRHGLLEDATVAFGCPEFDKTLERPEGERSMRARVADLFPQDTHEEISLDSVSPDDTNSAMIIREQVDPDSREIMPPPPPPSSIIRVPPALPDDAGPTAAPTQPGYLEPVSAVHRIQRGPRPLTIGLLLGAALVIAVALSLTVSLATTKPNAPSTLVGEQVAR